MSSPHSRLHMANHNTMSASAVNYQSSHVHSSHRHESINARQTFDSCSSSSSLTITPPTIYFNSSLYHQRLDTARSRPHPSLTSRYQREIAEIAAYLELSPLQTIVGHDPYRFGYPHKKTPSEIENPFWNHHPSWSQPDRHLSFYPGIGYRAKPLYITYDMGDRPVIIGHGPKFHFSKQTPAPPVKQHSERPAAKPAEKRMPREMVDVYSGDEFVERISLKTLVRFSTVASNALPKKPAPSPAQQQAAASSTHAGGEDAHGRAESMASIHITSPNWADDANSASEKTEFSNNYSSPSVSQADTPATTVVEDHKPETSSITRHFTRPKLALGTVENASDNIKKLRLEMDSVWLPYTQTVQQAIKWMKDNSTTPGDGALISYGPSDPRQIDFLTLLDAYATAVLFDLRPFPRDLRQELMDRVTASSPLSFNMFSSVGRYLPVEDPLVTRVVNQLHYSRRQRQPQYTPEQTAQFDEYINDPNGRKLKAKIEENAAYHKQVADSRRRQRAPQSRQKFWVRSSKNVDESAAVEEQAPTAESPHTAQNQRPHPRRRNRRHQQAKAGDQ